MDSAQRIMTIQVELDSRRLGGSALLIPFADSMLASTTCRQLLQQVLAEHLDKPDLLATSEKVSMFIIKQHDNVSGSGRKTRVDKDLANATDCMDMTALSVIEAFSTQFFTFKVTSQPAETPQARTLLNAFEVLKQTQLSFVFLPPRLEHARMYANHHSYNALLAFLEERQLVWLRDTAKTDGKRFVEGMSKAFFQCSPATWKSLNDSHNRGAIYPLCMCVCVRDWD